MDRDEFLKYLELYGGDIARWPSGLREGAEAACAGSSEMRDVLDQERRFEESLMERAYEEPSPGLEARIINAAARVNRPEARKSSLLGMLGAVFSAIPLPRPAIALPLLLVIGMAAGYLYADHEEQDADNAQYAELIYYGGDYDE